MNEQVMTRWRVRLFVVCVVLAALHLWHSVDVTLATMRHDATSPTQKPTFFEAVPSNLQSTTTVQVPSSINQTSREEVSTLDAQPATGNVTQQTISRSQSVTRTTQEEQRVETSSGADSNMIPISQKTEEEKPTRWKKRKKKRKFDKPFSPHYDEMISLLKQRATKDRTVLVTAVTFEYRKHLMNLKCNLDAVNMTGNYLIGALDNELYEWGRQQGLPVFLAIDKDPEAVSSGHNATNSTKVLFYSDEFQKVTKLKSRMVLKILEAGYSALWTDVDITWFRHPFAGFREYMGPIFDSIVIQSDAPYIQKHPDRLDAKPHPSVRIFVKHEAKSTATINSGCYLAKSRPAVIEAFQRIVEHAKKSKKTEQPSFNEILCRPHSIRHDDWCDYSYQNRRLNVQVLDRLSFPNGAVLVGEGDRNVYDLGKEGFEEATGKPLMIAHNNWIVGSTNKEERQVACGWWFLDNLSLNNNSGYSCKSDIALR